MTRAVKLATIVAFTAGALVVLSTTTPSVSVAQKPSPKFMKAYQAGQDAYNLGKFDEAKKQFEAARTLGPAFAGPHRMLAAVGKAQNRFGDCMKAAERFVELAPDSSNAPTVRKLHAECRKLLGRAEFKGQFGDGGAIAISTNVEGALVRLNGLSYGATPLEPRAFALGPVDVSVEKRGYIKQEAKATIVAGLVIDVVFTLEVDPKAKVAGLGGGPEKVVDYGWVTLKVSPKSASVSVDGKPAVKDEQGRIKAKPGYVVVIVEADGHASWHRRVRVVKGQSRIINVNLRSAAMKKSLRKKGYLMLGTAALLTASGIVFGLMERGKYEEAQDIFDIELLRPNLASTDFVPLRTRQDIQNLKDEGKTLGLVSNISYGLAAAALGASVYFFVQERSDKRLGEKLPVAITPILPTGNHRGVGVTATYKTEINW